MNLFNVDSDIDYLLLTMGKPISINGSSATAIIGYTSNKDIEEKKIITKSQLGRGDIIVANNHNYIVTNEINDKRQDCYYKAYAQSCNYNIKFNFNGTVKAIPSIIASGIFDIETGKYYSFASGKIQVTLQNTVDTNTIFLQERFIKMGSAWKVSGIDKTKTGLITLSCDLDSFLTNDDKDNEIAYNSNIPTPTPTPTTDYSIAINPNIADITEGSSQQFTVEVKSNGNVVTDKTVTWTLLNQAGTSTCASSVATLTNITGTSCTFNAVAMGNVCKLKAVLNTDNTVSASKDINIVGGW